MVDLTNDANQRNAKNHPTLIQVIYLFFDTPNNFDSVNAVLMAH